MTSRRRRYPVTKALWLLYAIGSLSTVCCSCFFALLFPAVIAPAVGAPPPPDSYSLLLCLCALALLAAGGLVVLFLSWLFDHLLDERIAMRAESIRRGIR